MPMLDALVAEPPAEQHLMAIDLSEKIDRPLTMILQNTSDLVEFFVQPRQSIGDGGILATQFSGFMAIAAGIGRATG